MKTFKDLDFTAHPVGCGSMARMTFENGYGISVVRFRNPYSSSRNGYGSYTLNEKQWEVAVLYNDDICYTTPITDDVIGYCSEEKVTEIMKQIQELR